MVKDFPAGLEKGANRKRLLLKYEIRLQLRFQPIIKRQNLTVHTHVHVYSLVT